MSSNSTGNFSKIRVFGSLIFGLTAIGFSPVLVRIVDDQSAFLVAAIRTVIAFLVLVPFHFASKKEAEPRQISKKEHAWVALSGILLGLHLICWIASISYTSIASSAVLVTTHPIILIIIERFVFKYRFRMTVWLGVFVAFSGSILLGFADYDAESMYPNPMLGNSLALLAAAIFAGYFLIGNRVRQKRNWLEYVFPVYGYAALTAVVALVIVEGISIEVSGLLLLVGAGLALGPQIIGHGSLNYVVKYVSPTLLATLILFEPVASSTMAFLFFGEIPSILSFWGMLIILIGISLTWSKKSEKNG